MEENTDILEDIILEPKYSVTLSDGTVIENLVLNGNNFVSDTEINPSVFTDNCCPVVVSDGTTEETHDFMRVRGLREEDGKYWFILLDISEEEMNQAKICSDIEYIAMMCDVKL